jgi:hypothetical protein
MFPSLSILQHYAKFDICTIATLEKLFGAKSFGGFIGHLARRQAIFFASLGVFGLLSMVKNYCPPILGVLGTDRFSTCHLFLAG